MKKKFGWSIQHDLVLFNITAYYGFLLNSMLCYFFEIPEIDNKMIIEWRDNEILFLTPIGLNKAKYIEPLFSFETKKDRISYILSIIETLKNT